MAAARLHRRGRKPSLRPAQACGLTAPMPPFLRTSLPCQACFFV
jgi:hypothetical protein